jgi:DNA-binding transcriptional regulator/RsmH inhibitor MraZ
MSLINFKDAFTKACETMFFDETAKEWLEVYLIPHLDKVYKMISSIKSLSSQNTWNPRPLPVVLNNYPGY